MELRRKFYDKLVKWKTTSQGTTSMLIEGARRVGKSYAATVFARDNYKSHIIIDFANIDPAVKAIFENNSTDLDLFFNKLSAFYGVKLHKRESLIVFDEVQLYPKARQLTKYLVADGRYDYLLTGSLITLKQNVENIVIPSEEESLTMHPLDFEEFLWAIGNDVMADYIKECFRNKTPLGQAMHRKAMDYFKQYMLVGGMPQAVLEYAQNHDFERTDAVKRRILKLYRNDISKFAKGYESKVSAIFDEIPSQLSKHEKKFNLASLTKNARMRDYEDAFMWLADSKVVNPCFNNTDPNRGLGLNMEQTSLKCYMADTGLLFSLAFSETEIMDNEVYKSILFDKLHLNEGMFMENIVAQMLVSSGNRLFFYSKNSREDAKDRIEIDFLIAEGRKIAPLEIKSARYQQHVSLDKFTAKYKERIGSKYIVYTKDLMVNDGVTFIPVYMTSLI